MGEQFLGDGEAVAATELEHRDGGSGGGGQVAQ